MTTRRRKLPKRDSKGRFVSTKDSSRRRSSPPHPLAGRLVINHFTGEAFTYDTRGRLRDGAGKYVKVNEIPVAESDGRVRTERMTFTEAIEFYDYDTEQLPDWVLYLVGSP